MKAGLILATAALAQFAFAQPHRNHHQHLHAKKDVVVEVEVVTATAPDAVVFVDQNGNPISTSFVNGNQQAAATAAAAADAAPTVAAAAAQVTADAATYAAPAQTSVAVAVQAVAATSQAAAAAAVATSSASSNTDSTSKSGSSSYGLTYSPYNADGTCKTASQVKTDFASLGDYSLVRLYGVDCNQLNTVGNVAINKGMKLFLGIYDISDVAGDVAEIISFAAGNWKHVDTVSIGNELVNSQQASVATVVAAVNTAKALLQAAGFTGSVVTVDTFNAVIANPELCQCSDYAAINAHAFFNPQTTAAQAGTYVSNIVSQVKQACGGKTVIVTESGWPSQGDANGVAVPGSAQQATAISSLKSAFSSNPAGLVLFTAYNDLWKKNWSGSFNAEQYWGMFGTSSA